MTSSQVLAEMGFPTVTIQDVAQHADVTKGAVYFHYANKEALAHAVADEFYRRIRDIAHTVENKELPPCRPWRSSSPGPPPRSGTTSSCRPEPGSRSSGP